MATFSYRQPWYYVTILFSMFVLVALTAIGLIIAASVGALAPSEL